MERAPLRPVPSRPLGPVDPAEAIRHVGGQLAGLDEAAVEALALIALVGRSRQEVTAESALSPEEVADALARARKALRRRLFPLPGSGWCERAERLISDRIDGVLADPGPARLEAHLGNCSRCVEHERRLGQAQDGLVEAFGDGGASAPKPEAEAEREPDRAPAAPGPSPPAAAALRVVDAPPEPAEADAPPELPEGDGAAELPEVDEAPELPEGDGAAELPEAGTAGELPAPGATATPPEHAAAPSAAAEPWRAWTPPPTTQVRSPSLPAPEPYTPSAPLGPGPRPARPAASAWAADRTSLPPHLAASLPSDDTWTAVGPLLVVGTLTALLLIFALVLAISL